MVHASLYTTDFLVCLSSLTLSQTTNFRIFQTERVLQTTISNLMNMAESSPKGLKTLFEKEKLLVTLNFSFSHLAFKRLVQQTHKNQGFFGKGLIYTALQYTCYMILSIYNNYTLFSLRLFFRGLGK